MSWDSYIDNLMGHANGSCDQVCIVGLDGSAWTSDDHANSLKATPAEKAAIGRALASGDYSGLQANGIHLAGIKYQFLRGDEGLLLAKKKDQGSITIQKSKTALVIGHTKEGGTQGNTNKGVATIAEYLESLGM